MDDYKYPYIPKEYYQAVMYACSCIRKYGTFNRAINAAANKYGVDKSEVEKHVRKRQGAGQKGSTRKYKYYLVIGYTDRWLHDYDTDILWSQAHENDWKQHRRKVARIIKATSWENAKKQINDNVYIDRDGRLCGDCISHYEQQPFNTERQAREYLERMKKT